MTTTHHTPLPFGGPLTSAAMEAPLGQLDAAVQAITVGSGGWATTLDGTANAGQKVVPVTSTANAVAGMPVYIGLTSGTHEVGVIDTISAGVSVTLLANLAATYASGTPISATPAEVADARGGYATLGAKVRGLVFDVRDEGAIPGAAAAINTPAIQATINAALAVGGRVLLPDAYNVGYEVNATLVIQPVSGTQSWVSIEGGGFPGLVWAGADNTPVIWAKGWKNSHVEGVVITIPTGSVGVVGWDIDDPAPYSSSSGITFTNCLVRLLGTNGIGWRGGVSGGLDISFLHFENCGATGANNADGNIGWKSMHANCLNWTWIDGAGTFLDTMIHSAGGGSMFVFGLAAGHNLLEYSVSGAASWTIVGGRYEVGKRFGLQHGNNAGGRAFPMPFTVIGATIAAYSPTDGILFEAWNSAQIVLDNVYIVASGVPMAWTASMIRLGSTGYGSLTVRNGVIETAADPFYTVLEGNWTVRIEDVVQTDAAGATVGHYVSSDGPDVFVGTIDPLLKPGYCYLDSANYAYLGSFRVSRPTTISTVNFFVAVSAGNLDMGIYDQTLARMASTGSFACPAAGARSQALTASVTLYPGQTYWAAVASDTTTAVISGQNQADIALIGRSRILATSFPLPASLATSTGGSKVGQLLFT